MFFCITFETKTAMVFEIRSSKKIKLWYSQGKCSCNVSWWNSCYFHKRLHLGWVILEISRSLH